MMETMLCTVTMMETWYSVLWQRHPSLRTDEIGLDIGLFGISLLGDVIF